MEEKNIQVNVENLVILEHGVENTDSIKGYADPLIEGIKKYLQNPNFEFYAYDWNTKAQNREIYMYQCVEQGLWRQKLRKLKHTMGGDVIGCARSKTGKDYLNQMKEELDFLIRSYIAFNPKIKVHLIGHSQGSQNLLNFCFDSNYQDNIIGLITLGSIISAGSWMYDDWGRVPPNLKYWHNFYNKFDFISSRLENYHPSESIKHFVVDHEVPIGWNPLNWTIFKAHIMYWKSDFCHKKIANILLKY